MLPSANTKLCYLMILVCVAIHCRQGTHLESAPCQRNDRRNTMCYSFMTGRQTPAKLLSSVNTEHNSGARLHAPPTAVPMQENLHQDMPAITKDVICHQDTRSVDLHNKCGMHGK